MPLSPDDAPVVHPKTDWGSIDAALDEILALPQSEWASASARIAGADAALLAEIRSLLSFASGEDPVLDRPLAPPDPGAPQPQIEGGTRVGAYRIVALLGRGGMGEVYQAERADGQFEQHVALKLIQPGAPQHLVRFHAERQILARLEHQNIARLLDGGIALDGRPYMIMELVAGEPIVEWCRRRGADLAERLRLFAEVCKAVAYAHRNLVVHRDLKPSNVLVTQDGTVKLLDFGVAKLLDAEEGMQTRNVPMTFGYAAPEQLTGGNITTATDVYALGLLLFELLCGELPWAQKNLPFAIALENTLRKDPESPSRFAAHVSAAPVPARALRGDLDSIVSKALKKTPAERYPNADLLAQDIQAYQTGAPVTARPDTGGYRLRKFLSRHKLGVAAAAAIAAAILGGAGAAWWQAQRALAEAHRARAVQSFVVSLFKGNLPDAARGYELTARELLVRGTEQIDRDLRSQPLALAEMHSDLGDMFQELEDSRNGLLQVERALQIYADLGQERSEGGIEALFRRGTLLLQDRQWDRARADLERCIEWGSRQFGARNRWAVSAREKLATIDMLTYHYAEALSEANDALAQPVGVDAANDAIRRLRVRAIIGQLQTDMGQYAAARETLSAALADSEGFAGYSIVDRFTYRISLARANYAGGNPAEAVAQTQALVPQMDQLLGATFERTIIARQLLSQALAALGRYDEASDVAQTNLDNTLKGASPSDDTIAGQKMVLANHLKRAARFRDARAIIAPVLVFYDERYPSHSLDSEYVRKIAGEIAIGDGDLAGGTQLIKTAMLNSPALPGFAGTSDEAGMAAAAAEADRLNGDWPGAARDIARSCSVLKRIDPEESLDPLRCNAELQWINAMQTPADAASAAAFKTAADHYRSKLPEGHVAAADLDLMQCELNGRAGHADAGLCKDAAQRWRAIMHRDPPPRFLFLH
jgi:tetratricopeptide (TPR) repeat protein